MISIMSGIVVVFALLFSTLPFVSPAAAGPAGYQQMFDLNLVEESGRPLAWWGLYRKVEFATQQGRFQDCVDGAADCEWDELRHLRERGRTDPLGAAGRLSASVSYRDDVTGHWQGPLETLTEGGDCEDHAILQMSALLALGFAPESLYVVALKSRRAVGLDHAILAVRQRDGWRFMDIGGRRRSALWIMRRYDPYLAYAAQGSVYGFARPAGPLAF